MRASFGPALLLAGPAGASHQPDKVERGVVAVFFFPSFFFFFLPVFALLLGGNSQSSEQKANLRFSCGPVAC